MLKGVVNSKMQAIVEVSFYNAQEELVVIPTLIDTGFDSMVSMPEAEVQRLGLEALPYPAVEIELADGERAWAVLYIGYIDWQSPKEKVVVYAIGNMRLIGMRLLTRCKVILDYRVITIE